ncbi:MAG: signal transduction histidine kinase [Bacteriovoracaceae bacterium]|jgi:signal transduction histidine kinase
MSKIKNQGFLDIENNKINSHRWLVDICALLFMAWSIIDFQTKEPLAPLFFTIRLIPFTLMVLFATPLNEKLFRKHHQFISGTILTLITTSEVIFLMVSKNGLSSNFLMLISLFLSTALLFQANYKYYLPIICAPMFALLALGPFIASEALNFEYSVLKLTFLTLITFIAHWNIYKFAEKSYHLRIKFEEKNAQTEKLLEDNNQLVRILCHDLGNALTIVEMSAGIIERHINPGEEQKVFFEKNLDRLKRAVNNQKEIINHVKQKEALESGKQKVENVPVSLNVVFEKVKFIFQDQVDEKEIQLSFNYSNNDKSPYVMAEMVSLSNNVINNIISNAIKFSPNKNQIIVSTWNDKNFVFVTIEDFGIGMNDDLLKNMFSTTVKTSRPGVRGEKGTGFGMPLAKSYMQKYGGEIIVESKVGRGTRFTLKFHGIEEKDQDPEILQVA